MPGHRPGMIVSGLMLSAGQRAPAPPGVVTVGAQPSRESAAGSATSEPASR